jgi:hypothetical protein
VIYALHHLLSSFFVHCTIKNSRQREPLPDGCPVYRLVTVILHDLFSMKRGSLGHSGDNLPDDPENAGA